MSNNKIGDDLTKAVYGDVRVTIRFKPWVKTVLYFIIGFIVGFVVTQIVLLHLR